MNDNTQSVENYPNNNLHRREYDPDWFDYQPPSIKWGCLPSYFANFAFPTASLPAGEGIARVNGNQFITIEPGRWIKDGKLVSLPVPSGLFPRLALPHIFRLYQLKLAAGIHPDQARIIDLAKTRNELLTKLGLSNSGKSYQMLNDQLERLARCRIALQYDFGRDVYESEHTRFVDISLTNEYNLISPEDPKRWNLRIVLGETLAKDIQDNPVPLDCTLMDQLARSSKRAETSCWTMDVASWLLYRLYRLGYNENKPLRHKGHKVQRISVSALRTQFPGAERDDHYLNHFEKTLKRVKSYWPSLVMPTMDRKGKAIWIVESPLPLSYQQLVKNRRQNDHQDTDS